MRTFTTIQGDTWDGIAKKTLGDEYLMCDLLDANPQHAETVIFAAGVQLAIPEKPTEQVTNLPPWRIP